VTVAVAVFIVGPLAMVLLTALSFRLVRARKRQSFFERVLFSTGRKENFPARLARRSHGPGVEEMCAALGRALAQRGLLKGL
jgi:hypothetical protein